MAETVQPTQTANTPYAGGGAGTAIGSLVGGLFNLVGAGINYGAQQQTNMKNEELLRESWARDDSQMQRARKDAEAAGFSPLAALGNMPGNTNPTTMQAPQLDTSGVSNSIEGALNRKREYDAMKQQQKLIDAQVEGAEEDTEGKKLDNLIRLAKAYDEIYGAKLDNYEKIGLLLDAEIITKDELPEAYKNLKANEAEKKNREIAQQNADTSEKQANETHRANVAAENAVKETNESTAEYSFQYLGTGVKLSYKHGTEGSYIPITSGVKPNERPAASIGSVYPSDAIYEITKEKDKLKKYFAGYTSDGLPVIYSKQGYTYVIVPSGRGNAKLYNIDKNDVIKATYNQWSEKYWKEYDKMTQKLISLEAFKN